MRESTTRGQAKPETLIRIAEVARMIARGYSWAATAKALGYTKDGIRNVPTRHRAAWKAALAAAMETVIAEVRQLAGTPQMLDKLNDYVPAAEKADQWTRRQGGELFPLPDETATKAAMGEHTLASFFERYYIPICLSEGSPATLHLYRVCLRKWAMLTGDPPIKAITVEVLSLFREALLRQRKTSRCKLNPITARNYLRMIQILLDKLGPRQRRNRDAANYFTAENAPWVQPIKAEMPEPKIVPLPLLAACYEAASAMTVPELLFAAPVDWWRALLVVAYNLGLRRRTLFGLDWSMVDWGSRVLRVPAPILKGKRRLVLPLNEVVVTHLRSIKYETGKVFPWPYSREWFGREFARLQTSAGILSKDQFGLHTIRKTCATMLWKKDKSAAQLMLGHTALAITQQHYVDAVSGLAEVVAGMPQPFGFEK